MISVWKENTSTTSGRPYYTNILTNESKWKVPDKNGTLHKIKDESNTFIMYIPNKKEFIDSILKGGVDGPDGSRGPININQDRKSVRAVVRDTIAQVEGLDGFIEKADLDTLLVTKLSPGYDAETLTKSKETNIFDTFNDKIKFNIIKDITNPLSLYNLMKSNIFGNKFNWNLIDWNKMFIINCKSELDELINYASDPDNFYIEANKEEFYHQLKQLPTETIQLNFFKSKINQNENFWLYYNTMVLMYLENKFGKLIRKYAVLDKFRSSMDDNDFSYLNLLLIHSIPDNDLDPNRKIEQEFLINLGANLKKIPDSYFRYEPKLYDETLRMRHITIPRTIENIDIGAFSNNNLTNVIMGDNVTYIGVDAFTYNPNLLVTNLNLESLGKFIDDESLFTVFDNDAILFDKNGNQIKDYLYKEAEYKKYFNW